MRLKPNSAINNLKCQKPVQRKMLLSLSAKKENRAETSLSVSMEVTEKAFSFTAYNFFH